VRLAHTVAEVRTAEAERLADLPAGALMERAAAGLAAAVLDLLGGGYGRRVALLVGSGDNGGDALVAGARLARRGCAVEAVLVAPDQAHPAGLAALLRSGGRVVDAGQAQRPEVLIDGIVGIGASGGLRPAAESALAAFAGVPVVAVDVPSGVDVDSGRLVGPHVEADLTVTFGTHKVAHLVDPAAAACGVVHLVDLGLDLPEAAVESLQAAEVADLLPRPAAAGHKYSRGVVGLRTGSTQYPGAALLSVAGAACGLAGMVRYDGTAAHAVRTAHPEVVGPGRVQAWVTGSGGGDGAADALAACRDDGVPIVIDAAALAAVPGPLGVPTVLTPHAGELATMLGIERAAVEADQLQHARLAADRYEAVVLLKGRHTLVARPDGRVRVNTTGLPWLGTAGAGDVLAGLIGAVLAAGCDPYDAASLGAWLHGAAATYAATMGGGTGPIVASDVAHALPRVVADLC
jgi:ADP-dependent NAD(P)H-hydrate dehydratase / NAD(P)H-hydrate epimerase